MVLIKRRVARELTYSRRWQSLTANDQVKNRTLKKAMTMLALKIRILSNCKDGDVEDRTNYLRRTLQLLTIQYINLNYRFSSVDDDKPLTTTIYDEDDEEVKDKNLEHFLEIDCYSNFGFRKPELRRMIDALNIPETVNFSNGKKLSGEEAFLRGLYELRTGENQHRI